MAVKIPIVMNQSTTSSVYEQLQPGDTISGGGGGPDLVVLNASISGITIGQACYNALSGNCDKAQANGLNQTLALGLATNTAPSGLPVSIQHNGQLTLTTAQWDAVTGQVGGLTPSSTYYLDPVNAGKITVTKPVFAGQYVRPMGIAISSTIMLLIDYTPPILL
jgi:hypothetical protein